MSFRNWWGTVGLGPKAPASWVDEYGVVVRFFEYQEDIRTLDKRIVDKRWWSGYYAQPIPYEYRIPWIIKHWHLLTPWMKGKAERSYDFNYYDYCREHMKNK